MTKKIELILSALFTGILGIYSYLHPLKYHIFIPIMFGILFILAIYLLVTLDKK